MRREQHRSAPLKQEMFLVTNHHHDKSKLVVSLAMFGEIHRSPVDTQSGGSTAVSLQSFMLS